jgi:hypothetical protein
MRNIGQRRKSASGYTKFIIFIARHTRIINTIYCTILLYCIFSSASDFSSGFLKKIE